MEIILIDIGIFQEYILDNIRNLKLFGNENITVITDPHLIDKFKEINVVSTADIETNTFDKNNKLPEGFWANCSKRLFLLYSYMKKYNRTNCIHIENDYTIYFSTKNLKESEFLWLTMDSPNRCIPGIVFIHNYSNLEPLINNYDFSKNDMENMAKFHNSNDSVKSFPIHFNSEYFDTFEMIFDAAAIGQYLGGIDTIHKNGGIPGFVNETCIIDFSKYTFHWVKENELFVPMIKVEDRFYKIAGLHIHSKRLSNFQGDSPKEQTLIKYL